MDQNDRHAIEGLFGKLSAVERQAGSRDAEAETFIRERIASQPAAPYFMAQTIVMQDQALNAAQQRIEQLEHDLANQPQQSGGGLFSSLFGNGARPAPQPRSRPAPATAPGPMHGATAPAPVAAGPWGQQGAAALPRPAGGGGFLAGAAQTAMGVAGGVLLGNAIAGMLSGDTANAAEPAQGPAQTEEPAEEMENDDLGMDDMEF